MTPVNQITSEGLPDFYIKDLPPATDSLTVTRPEIYFGEKTFNYVIVNSKIEDEFDFPKGDSNVYTNYQGQEFS